MKLPKLEENIIITLLNYPQEASAVCSRVVPEMFATKKHREVYETMYALWSDGIEITAGNLMLKGRDVEEYLFKSERSGTDGELVVSAYLEEYRNFVDMEFALQVHREASTGGDVMTVKGEWDRKLNLVDSQSSRDPYGEFAAGIIDRIEKRRSNILITGITTGFQDMDVSLSGWQDQDLIILGATPSVGKTALALYYAMKAVEKGIPVGIVSAEMSFKSLMNRIVAYMTGINSMNIRDGFLSDEEAEKVLQCTERLRSTPLYVEDSTAVMEKVRARMIDMRSQYGVGLFVVDYIQLLTWAARKESKRVAVGDIGLELKRIAKKLNVPVIALSQLTRLKGAKPRLDDLKESGDLEAHADVVQLLSAHEMGKIHISQAKNRNGDVGEFYKVFDKKTNRFYDDDPYAHQTPF